MKVALRDFAPDLDTTIFPTKGGTQGYLTDSQWIYSVRGGWATMPTPGLAPGNPRLPSKCFGCFAYPVPTGTNIVMATASQLYVYTGAGREVSQGLVLTNTANPWSFTNYASIAGVADAWAVNGIDRPLKTVGGGAWAVAAGNPPVFSIIEATDFSLFGIIPNSQEYWFTFNDTLWIANIATQTGFNFLSSTSGNITAFHRIRAGACGFKPTSMFSFQFVGPPLFWQTPNISETVGTRNQDAVTGADDVLYFLGPNDFYSFDGYSLNQIPNNLRSWFFANADPNFLNTVTSAYDQPRRQVIWYFASIAANPVGTHDRYISLSLLDGKWATGYLLMEEPIRDAGTESTYGYMDAAHMLRFFDFGGLGGGGGTPTPQPVAFRAIGANVTNSASVSPQTFAVPMPAFIGASDQLLCVASFYIAADSSHSGATLTYTIAQTTPGWVLVGQSKADNFGHPGGVLYQSPNIIQVYRNTGVGAAAPSFTITFASSVGTPFATWDAYVLDYINVDPANPIDASAGTTSGIAVDTALSTAVLTPTIAGDMLVIGVVADSGPINGPPFIVGSPALTGRALDTDILAISDGPRSTIAPTPTYSFSVNPINADGQMVTFTLLLKAKPTAPIPPSPRAAVGWVTTGPVGDKTNIYRISRVQPGWLQMLGDDPLPIPVIPRIDTFGSYIPGQPDHLTQTARWSPQTGFFDLVSAARLQRLKVTLYPGMSISDLDLDIIFAGKQ